MAVAHRASIAGGGRVAFAISEVRHRPRVAGAPLDDGRADARPHRRTYSLDEIVAEKLRSTRQTQATLAARGWVRSRARDYFDLWHLVRLAPGRIDWARVAAVLPRKCAHRHVTIDQVADVFDAALLDEVRATWERTLGPFVAELPDVERVLPELHLRLDSLLKL